MNADQDGGAAEGLAGASELECVLRCGVGRLVGVPLGDELELASIEAPGVEQPERIVRDGVPVFFEGKITPDD